MQTPDHTFALKLHTASQLQLITSLAQLGHRGVNARCLICSGSARRVRTMGRQRQHEHARTGHILPVLAAEALSSDAGRYSRSNPV